MEYTNEILEKILEKKMKYNDLYSVYYYFLYKDTEKRTYRSKSESIKECLDIWDWHKYEKNKILDLQSVNRCKNNRFCPNCKILEVSKFINKFRKVYKEHSLAGYKAYMLTLTIPSMQGKDLRSSIDKLFKDFGTFKDKFSYDIGNKKTYKERFFKIEGGIRVLEITYNNYAGFHPHLHCVVLVKDSIDSELLIKNVKGRYSNKRKSNNLKSLIDIQISKVWSMIFYNESFKVDNINKIKFDISKPYFKGKRKVLECDFRELDEKGIYEVFKYTFKDNDVDNLSVFRWLVIALESRRLRQGFGILHNMKCEDVEEGEIQELILKYKESPSNLLVTEIDELLSTYREYKKVSRFNSKIDSNIM